MISTLGFNLSVHIHRQPNMEKNRCWVPSVVCVHNRLKYPVVFYSDSGIKELRIYGSVRPRGLGVIDQSIGQTFDARQTTPFSNNLSPSLAQETFLFSFRRSATWKQLGNLSLLEIQSICFIAFGWILSSLKTQFINFSFSIIVHLQFYD